ncbi:MAG: hypothetical protein JWM59_4019 [Verrucomicrobiales bacterium]|nr:hypothetical protein [Verrucomicrobiales bacterium]
MGAVVPVAWSQTPSAPPSSVARPALEFKFDTQEGKVYVVEGSSDGTNWAQVSPPVFGDGQPATVRLRVDGADGRIRYPYYRPQEVDAALYGPAPGVQGLEGRTLLLNDNGRERQLILYKEIQGQHVGVLKTDATHVRSFTYKAVRTAQDTLRLELTYFDKTTAVATIQFLDQGLGTYQMREYGTGGILQGVDAGGFGLHTARPAGNADSSLPATFAGSSLLAIQGGRVTRMEFLSPDEVVLHHADGSQDSLPYDYDLNSPGKGTVRITLPSEETLVYDLSLTGGGSGTLTQNVAPPPGQLPAAGDTPNSGSFNLPPKDAPPPMNSNCPPKSLDGKSIILSGSDPVTLYFQADGTGTSVKERGGSVEITPFFYDYSPNTSASANLSVTFPGVTKDKVNDYDLDFNADCTGTYQASSFQNGESNLVSNGGFSTSGGVTGHQ